MTRPPAPGRLLDPPDSPILVEVTRGDRVESCHRGSVVVADASGAVVAALGDPEAPILPRSAVKALQALPLVASGAADAFGLDDRALALACASHNGEPEHIAGVSAALAAADNTVGDLACGAQWPMDMATARSLAIAGGGPSALHHQCSGKHAGFLALARHLGVPAEGYLAPAHPVQLEARAAIEATCGVTLDEPTVDGCSAPAWPIPLRALACGFARFGTGEGMAPDRAAAAERLRAAVAAQPFFVAGTDRFCTDVMAVTGPRAFVKLGAEGVYTAALPDLGLGVALKVDDGAYRACEVAMAAVLDHFLADPGLARFVRPKVRSTQGQAVGEVRPGPVWADLSS